MLIKELKDGDRVYGPYLVADCKKGVTAQSKTYLTLTLQDASGTIEARKWDYTPEDEAIFEKGKVAHVEGSVIIYSNHLQMKVYAGESMDQSSIDWSLFVPSAPVDAETMKAKLDTYIESIRDEDVKKLVVTLLDRFMNKYLRWPAAVRNHHNFAGGLLYHSLTMADLAAKVCRIYPSLNRDVMIGGVLIHDIGKTVELSGPQGTQFTLQGKLIGHISIGHAELREVAKELHYYDFLDLPDAEKAEKEAQNDGVFHRYEIAATFEHILLSHHGKHDFGSPVLPLTREALAISMIDDLDAKMLILDNSYAGVKPGETTAKIFALDERYFYKPHYAKEEGLAYGTSLEEEKKDLESEEDIPWGQGKLF